LVFAAERSDRFTLEMSGGVGRGFDRLQVDTVDFGTRPVYARFGDGQKFRIELGVRVTPRFSVQVGVGHSLQEARWTYASQELDQLSTDSTGYAAVAELDVVKQRALTVAMVPLTLGIRLAGGRSEGGALEPYAGVGFGVFLPVVMRATLEQRGSVVTHVYAPNGPQQVYYRDFARYETTTFTPDTGYGGFGRAGVALRLGPRLALTAEVRYTHLFFFLTRIETVYREERVDPADRSKEIYYGTNVYEFAWRYAAPDPLAAETVSNGGSLKTYDDGRVYYREEMLRNESGNIERRRDDRSRAVGKPATGASSIEGTLGLIVNY